MRKQLWMGCLLLLVLMLGQQACKLLKNVNTETEKQAQSSRSTNSMQLKQRNALSTDQHFLEWKLDSSSTSAVVQIWPKGKFKFSQEDGFEGEAERLVLTTHSEKSERGLKVKDSLTKIENQLDLETLQREVKKQEQTKIAKTETPAFWLIIGVAAMVIAGVFIYKLLKP
ncbi:hypothetical protein LPB86_16230 [Pedobacter sp. MC2016-14]|uniref:hypothetical protein n=1 Tax=Pedobacter sp. MC2016-14 TaxID=2897327 RepID=UPI001E514E82|nr:hypothetical protein [Pedobacter sp. MC2016-14]MCD0489792.1 hypothetical protein [Pedobacter sp. MC2016-14]